MYSYMYHKNIPTIRPKVYGNYSVYSTNILGAFNTVERVPIMPMAWHFDINTDTSIDKRVQHSAKRCRIQAESKYFGLYDIHTVIIVYSHKGDMYVSFITTDCHLDGVHDIENIDEFSPSSLFC